MLGGSLSDVKHSLRSLANSPVFTLAAVATLALGIGVNTAVFSVVNAVLLKPIGLRDADRLVLFMVTAPQGSFAQSGPALFQHSREQSTVVEHVSAYSLGRFVSHTGGELPEELPAAYVSRDFFRLFGVPLALGRSFTPEEDLPGGPRVVVISQGLWEARFERDPGVLGRTISLGGEAHTIIGVLGEFDFRDLGSSPQVLLPFQLDPASTDLGLYFRSAGRLREGASLQRAQERVSASRDDYVARFPGAMGQGDGLTVEPVREVLVGDARPTLLVLFGAVCFVLLIACANVATLLLARATGRRRELAIRAAVGGSRRRIIRQLLTESLVLSFSGGVLGLIAGWAGVRGLLAVNTAGLPRVGQDGSLVGMEWRVVVFTLGVAGATGLLFGLLPALRSSRVDLTTGLKGDTGRWSARLSRNRARPVLVTTQVALAVVLLTGSGLLIRTAVALARVDPGFDTRDLLILRTPVAESGYFAPESLERLVREGTERLRALPGVVEASAACCVPLVNNYGMPFEVVGRPLEAAGAFHGGADWRAVSPRYFEVFGIPLRGGRTFTEQDNTGGESVAIINETMARQFWPDGDPLNERIVIGRGVMPQFAAEPERTIVGIVGDTRYRGLGSEPSPTMYIPQAQTPDSVNALVARLTPLAWIVRTQGWRGANEAGIREELLQATGLPISSVRTMHEVRAQSMARERFNMWLMTVFGGSALLLAAIGVYGLMAYSVEQRAREIGVRVALGARPVQIRNMVVVQGMAPAAIGLLIGLGAAFGLARLLAAFLFGVTARDTLVFGGVPALLAAAALLAAWLPARRVSRIDPTAALRQG